MSVEVARGVRVGGDRTEATRNPGDTELADLIDELAQQGPEFARR